MSNSFWTKRRAEGKKPATSRGRLLRPKQWLVLALVLGGLGAGFWVALGETFLVSSENPARRSRAQPPKPGGGASGPAQPWGYRERSKPKQCSETHLTWT